MNAYQTLEQLFKELDHINHLSAITQWDEAVNMPVGGGEARAEALAYLEQLRHERLTDPAILEEAEAASQLSLSDPWHARNRDLMVQEIRLAQCLPSDLVIALKKACIKGEQKWRVTRADNDWAGFCPYLEEIIQLTRKAAVLRGECLRLAPYDALIDQFSPGLTQALIDPIFAELKQILPAAIDQVLIKQTPAVTPQGPFPIEQQKKLCLELMKALGFDFNHGRMDVSHHPFCGGVPSDVRITTRFNTAEWMTAAMGICHETGHAKYEQQLPADWCAFPVGKAQGMAMHESQSLLIEMQVCRSAEFMQYLSNTVKKILGEQAAFSPDNLYALYTQVKKGFIRVDADELTYPLHVILRYELEQALIDGTLSVRALPEAWEAKMQTYFGLSTKNNFKEGVMQDVHWPAGLLGYFPAYTMGAIIAAQLFASAKQSESQLMAGIAVGDFSVLQNWLAKKVHVEASRYTFQDLIREATKASLSVEYFLAHLKKRYGFC